MSKKSTGLKREITDAFYTLPEVAIECIEFTKKLVKGFKKYDLIVESSAGNGSFSDFFHKNYPEKLVAVDINPKKKYIQKLDFLDYDTGDFNGKILCIGNPPFGRQSSLAKQFIKKCSEFSTIIAFILPKSFKKESMQKCFPLNFHLIGELDISLNSFCVDKESYNVPCVFQVWRKKKSEREVSTRQIPNGYTFVKKSQDPHFSIRRVGGTAGKIDRNYDEKSEESHYFIRLDDENFMEEFENKYNNIEFETNNTVGPKSIGKYEFIRYINDVLE